MYQVREYWYIGSIRARSLMQKKSSEALLADESLQPSQRRSLQRQLQLQEYMASQMSERLLEHQHRLSTLRLRLTLLNTPRQAGFLRVRNAPDGPFDTYWAELRRDKKVYFFSPPAPQGSRPRFALELARVESAKVVEVDGHSVGRPLIPKAPLLQLILSDLGGGRIQIGRDTLYTALPCTRLSAGGELRTHQGRFCPGFWPWRHT